LVTAGEDGRIAIWHPGDQQPVQVFEGQKAPVVSLAVSPDGSLIASASWDRIVRLWPLAGGAPRVLEGHQQNVNGVAFMPDGKSIVSVGYDATVRIWPIAADDSAVIVSLPTPLNAVAVAIDGEILTAGADGKIYFLSAAGEKRGAVEIGQTPITSIAVSSDGTLVAGAEIGGSVEIIERKSRAVARTLIGPGLPIWAVAFAPDSRTLLTGGADRLVRRWDTKSGEDLSMVSMGGPEDPLTAYADDRGAEVFRACIACHTLTPNKDNRAGPTLSGIFGRKIATLPGYNFSPALKQLNIVWTPETVAKLFEVGPAIYTPGTKMPEQIIGARADREALVRFLEKVTRQK
jgi:cytochrome c